MTTTEIPDLGNRPDDTSPTDGATTFDARRRNRGGLSILGGGERSQARRRPRVILLLCAIWLGFMVFLALFASVLPIADPTKVIGAPNVGPSWSREFLGTDAVGRSMVSRLVFGAQVSFEISVLVTLVACVVGGTVGLLAVYFRGIVNFIADTIANTILSLPGILLLLTIIVVFHPTVKVLVLSIALVFFPGFMRVTRARTRSLVEQDYIVAARSLGAGHFRIIVRELLPNAAVSLVTFAVLALPGAMLAEGGLSYLGFGVQPPTPSWGQMIAQGQQMLTTAPWQAIIPCIVFAFTIFAMYSLGDWLRIKIDVRGSAGVE